MPDDVAQIVDAVRRHGDGCYGSGRSNPFGLQLDGFGLNDGRVSARFTPRAEYRGAGTMLHGGVAATALDEILVWAGILVEGVVTVTGNVGLRFRQPVHVDEAIVVSGRVEERSGRKLQLSGELSVDDETKVDASELYLVTRSVADMLAHQRDVAPS